MTITSKNQLQIAYKKLVGKSHTNVNASSVVEAYPTAVQSYSSIIFGEIPSSDNGNIELVEFTLEALDSSVYPITELVSDKAEEISTSKPHGYRLKFPSNYSGHFLSLVDPVDGLYVDSYLKIQIVPLTFGNQFLPTMESENGVPMYQDGAQDWILDYFSGIVFMQDALDETPDTLTAYVYTGKYLDEMVEEAASSGGSADAVLTTNVDQTIDGTKTFLNDIIVDNNIKVGNIGGQSNTGIGSNIMNSAAATSQYNVAIGSYSLVGLTTGKQNTSVGALAGFHITNNNENTCLGYAAGYNTVGNYNTFIGSNAGYPGNTLQNLSHTTIISNGNGYERLRIHSNGNVSIGSTANNGYKLDVNGTIRGSHFHVGGDTNLNYIAFHGTTGDGLGDYNHSFIAERIYSSTERSELLIFKANDPSTSSGKDRIRLAAAEIRFDTYNASLPYSPAPTIEQYATNADVINRMIVTSDGKVGIGTTEPVSKLHLGAEVADDNGYPYDPDSLYVVHQTPTSDTALNDPEEVLLLARQGTSSKAYGAAASFRLSRFEDNSTNSRTRLDLVLAHDKFLNGPKTVLTVRSDGRVGIGTTEPAGSFQLEVANKSLFYEGINVGERIAFTSNNTEVAATIGNFKIAADVVPPANGSICHIQNGGTTFFTLYDDYTLKYVNFTQDIRIENNNPVLLLKNTTNPDSIVSFYGKNPYDNSFGTNAQIMINQGTSSDIKFAIKTINYGGTLSDSYYIHHPNNSLEHVFNGNVKIAGNFSIASLTLGSYGTSLSGVYQEDSTSIGKIYLKCNSGDGGIYLQEKDSTTTWNIIYASSDSSSGLVDDGLYFSHSSYNSFHFTRYGDLVTPGGATFEKDLVVETPSFNFKVQPGGYTTLDGDILHVHTNGNFYAVNILTEYLKVKGNINVNNGILHTTSSRVGIGNSQATNPRARLQIKQSSQGTSGGLLLERSNTTDYWAIFLDDLNSGGPINNNLGFWYNGSRRGYINPNANGSNLNFTGQHRNISDSINVKEKERYLGLIVVSDGTYASIQSNSITLNEALPKVSLASKRNQKSVFGVVSDAEDENAEMREYALGNFISVSDKTTEDTRLIINSLGEGGIWITNVNGNLENGDYITTCEIPGYGMKQDDDLLHNYTVAKITCDCDFNLESPIYICEEFEHEGTMYKRAFVGCTYHCG